MSITLRKVVILILLFPSVALSTECEKLSPLACLESVKCTLDCKRDPKSNYRCRGKESYFCRSEEGSCEMATNQLKLTKEECEAKESCSYNSSSCFCICDFKPFCACECGGGVPPNCESK